MHLLLQARLLFFRCSHSAATYLRIRREEIAVECAVLGAFNPSAAAISAVGSGQRTLRHNRSAPTGASFAYGLVVVVVVVSSCFITAAGRRANTTLRTTTRSPTVE